MHANLQSSGATSVVKTESIPRAPRLACSVYCVQDDDVLLLERKKPPFVGHWVAPGGKLDPGEAPFQAARRELLEETGLHAKDMVLRGIVRESSENGSLEWLIFYYVVTSFTGALTSDEREGRLAWWPRSAIALLKIPETDRRFMGPILALGGPVYEGHFYYNANEQLTNCLENEASSGSVTTNTL